jgi:hypothetical protein
LRSEIILRIRLRQQALTFTLLILGTVLTVGFRDAVPPHIFLAYPFLALFLAIAWAHSDRRIGEIGKYIDEHIEKRIPWLGWERQLQNHRRLKPDGWKFLKRPMEQTGYGVFVLAACLSIILGLHQIEFKMSLDVGVLLLLDIFALVITLRVLPCRRALYNEET